MSSYNKVNGSYVGENKELLTDILRDEWGFDGFVVSDWGAVSDRIKALPAGLDLEMPASGGMRDAQIVKAVQDGTLNENVLDTTCERILNIVYRYMENRDENSSSAEAITAEMNAAMEKFMPLRAVISFSDGKITPDQIEEAVDKLNKL